MNVSSVRGRWAAVLAACSLAACHHEGRPAPVVPEPVSLPAARYHPPRVSPIDVLHYAIDVSIEPETRSITGTTNVRFKAADQDLVRVELDFAGLEVFGVTDVRSGYELEFQHAREVLAIDLASVLRAGATTEVAISYGGRPAKGLWFAGEKNGEPTHVFTQGECEDSRWWFPCWDAPSDFATTELRVTMPVGWRSVAAGDRIERTEGRRTATEHWRMDRPHAAYLTTLVAGAFHVEEELWDDVPLQYIAEPHYARWMEASFSETPDVLSFLSELTGTPYPYSKYSQACVENFPFGGMENITATTLTSLTLDDELGNRDDQSHGLVAHEAAHQWFGNLLTCADWSDIWLNESFATYATLLYFERTRGIEDFRVRMRDAQEDYLEADEALGRPIVYAVYKDPIDLFGPHVYPGGASRLHLLRSILGDDVFVDGVRAYVRENAGRPVTTDDLQSAFESVSGENLKWFFDQWIRSPGFPEFETSWTWDDERGVLTYTVAQTQIGDAPRAFRTPVDIEVRDRGGRSTHRVWIDKRRHVFEFPVRHDPIWVRFDKFGFIPKRMRAERSPREWIAIAVEDDDVNGRRDAVAKLGWLAMETADLELREVFRAEIVKRLREDRAAAVRTVAAVAAGNVGGLESRAQLVESAASDPEAGVREVAFKALTSFGEDPELAQFAREQFEARFSWDVMGAAAGLVASSDPEEAYAWLTAKLLLDSPHDQLRVDLLHHLGSLENTSVSDQLKLWVADESAHPNARAAAVEELARRASGRASVAGFLAGFIDVEDFRLRSAVLEALGTFENPRTRRTLLTHYRSTVFPREKRIIEAALGTGH